MTISNDDPRFLAVRAVYTAEMADAIARDAVAVGTKGLVPIAARPVAPGSIMWRFASTAVMGAVGIACKAALALGTRTTTVVNRDAFVNLLLSQSQVPPKDRRGILVVANHRSTLDDPFMWGTLPLRILLRPDMMRWTLGAQELCFATPAASTFFTLGQTVPTLRGAGITQPAIDEAINRLDAGQVIHIFPEGHVNQDTTRFRRFKWGLARMLLETQRIPYVVPVFLDGFEKVMPMEPLPSRKNATKFPIPGQDVTVAFGKPSGDGGELERKVMEYRERVKTGQCRKMEARRDITAMVQKMVEELRDETMKNIDKLRA